MTDIVYCVRPGDDNEELRHSLRSLKNIEHGTVWIVGYKPRWVRGVEYLPTRQTSHKWANARANLLIACTHPDVSKMFQLWNDDFYVLASTAVPTWHAGQRIPDRHRGNSATHRDGGEATRRLLERWGFDPILNYDVHVPMVIEGPKMADAIGRALAERMIPALHCRTLYGNLYQVGGEQVKDVAIDNRRDTWADGQEWVSTSDKSFGQGLVGQRIREHFPDPGPYEE
jgi:hypothetical protein